MGHGCENEDRKLGAEISESMSRMRREQRLHYLISCFSLSTDFHKIRCQSAEGDKCDVHVSVIDQTVHPVCAVQQDIISILYFVLSEECDAVLKCTWCFCPYFPSAEGLCADSSLLLSSPFSVK